MSETPDVCGTCGSDVAYRTLVRRGLRGGARVARSGGPVPDHCTNPDCRRSRSPVLGWAIKREDWNPTAPDEQ